jgi:hypothetical protein
MLNKLPETLVFRAAHAAVDGQHGSEGKQYALVFGRTVLLTG